MVSSQLRTAFASQRWQNRMLCFVPETTLTTQASHAVATLHDRLQDFGQFRRIGARRGHRTAKLR